MCFGAPDPVESIRIELPSSPGPVAQRASTLLAREINERSGIAAGAEESPDLTISLTLRPFAKTSCRYPEKTEQTDLMVLGASSRD